MPSKSETGRVGRLSLRTRLIGAVALVSMISAGLWIDHVSRSTLARALEAERARLRAVAATLAPRLDGELHETLARTFPDEDQVRAWSDAPGLARLRDPLVQAHDDNRLGSEVYTLRLDPEAAARVRAAPDQLHPGAMQFVVSTAETPYWRHTYTYRPQMAATLERGEVVTTDLYEDAHGAWLSAYAPVRDARGEVVALLEVDARQDALIAAAADDERRDLTTAALVLGPGFLLLLLLGYRTTTELRDLARSARRFGDGDYDTPFEARRVGGEIAVLRDTLEEARRHIQADVQARSAHAATLSTALERAERAARAKADFLANISHEIRTPIHGVTGVIELMSGPEPEVSLAEGLALLRASSAGLSRIIDELLDLSSIDADEVALARTPVDVRALLEAACAHHEAAARDRGLSLTATVDPTVPTQLLEDGPRLEQVLRHLVDNAVRYSERGTIEVQASLRGEEWCLTVRDEGVGICADDLPHVFEPFFQADTSSTRRHGGTGVGLTLVRRMVALMCGRVDLHSEVGVGTTVTVHLPCHHSPALAPPAPIRAVEPEPGDDALLLVEDNRVNQLVARRLAERLGYVVTCAENGAEALAHCRDQRFAVILMDCQMPVMDGFEATQRIRRTVDWGADVPIVAVTANVTETDRARCRAAGMDGVLAKPFAAEALQQLLGRAANAA